MACITTRNQNQEYWTQRVGENPVVRHLDRVEAVGRDYAADTEKRPFLIVGDPGCGTISALTSKLRAAHRRFVMIRSGGTREELADQLQTCAHTQTLVICDNAADMLRDVGLLQVLLTATIPQHRGEKRNYELPIRAKGIVKTRRWCFDNLVICFLSSTPQHMFASEPRSAEIRTLLDRCTHIEQDSTSPAQMFDYIAYMVIVREYMKPLGYPVAIANTMLDFITARRGEIKLSLQWAETLVVGIASSPKGWRTIAEASLRRSRAKTFDVPETPRIIPAAKIGKKPRCDAASSPSPIVLAPAPADNPINVRLDSQHSTDEVLTRKPTLDAVRAMHSQGCTIEEIVAAFDQPSLAWNILKFNDMLPITRTSL